MKLMHEVTHPSFDVRPILRTSRNKKQDSNDSVFTLPSFGLKENFKEVYDFAELNSKMTNSRQTSNQLNSLQWQVSSLQQRLASHDKSFSDLLSYNWLFPKGAIQGISGYVCKKCQTFSLKAIIDIGYDMTMERKHRCIDSPDKRSYIVLPIPSDIPNIDDWAAQCLLDQVNFYIPIGKYLIAKDITKAFSVFQTGLKFDKALNSEIIQRIIGIPDQYCSYPLEKNYKINWVDRAIDNLGKKIIMTDYEALDFFRKVKSTYAIFELPIGETVRQFFMFFTNY